MRKIQTAVVDFKGEMLGACRSWGRQGDRFSPRASTEGYSSVDSLMSIQGNFLGSDNENHQIINVCCFKLLIPSKYV
jgi:hypothetical protein